MTVVALVLGGLLALMSGALVGVVVAGRYWHRRGWLRLPAPAWTSSAAPSVPLGTASSPEGVSLSGLRSDLEHEALGTETPTIRFGTWRPVSYHEHDYDTPMRCTHDHELQEGQRVVAIDVAHGEQNGVLLVCLEHVPAIAKEHDASA